MTIQTVQKDFDFHNEFFLLVFFTVFIFFAWAMQSFSFKHMYLHFFDFILLDIVNASRKCYKSSSMEFLPKMLIIV